MLERNYALTLNSVQQIRENTHVTISLLPCARWDGGFSCRRDLEIPCPQRAVATSKDRDLRTLATVMLHDGWNFNHELVRDDWCRWYQEYAPTDTGLKGLEKEAREARIGLWADPHPLPPWEWRKWTGLSFGVGARLRSPQRDANREAK